MKRHVFSIALVGLLVLTNQARALQATQPNTTQPAVQHLKATVTGVEGLVQVRSAETQPWQRAQVGIVVNEQAEFRTGPKSAVRFVIPPDQTVTLDRLGTVKVLEAVSDGGKLKTNLGMKYGRTRYDIEAAGREHDSTITSPSNTLAVRGTKVSVLDQRPFPAEAVSLTGRAEFRDFKKRTFLGGQGAKAKITTEKPSAAEFALSETVVDPTIALARTTSEDRLVEALLSTGAVVSFDFEKGIKVIRGGRPLTDRELIPTLPGRLDFVLRWHGDADLNLAVVEPGGTGSGKGTIVLPIGGLDIIPSGGQTGFDHRGGKNGGMEVVFWPRTFPAGLYSASIINANNVDIPATLDVFVNGKRVGIQYFDPVTQKFVNTKTSTIQSTVVPKALKDIEAVPAGMVDLSGVRAAAVRVQSTGRSGKR